MKPGVDFTNVLCEKIPKLLLWSAQVKTAFKQVSEIDPGIQMVAILCYFLRLP